MEDHFDRSVGATERLFDTAQLWQPGNTQVLYRTLQQLPLGLLPETVHHMEALPPVLEVKGPKGDRVFPYLVQGHKHPVGPKAYKAVYQAVPLKGASLQEQTLPQP